MHTAPVCVRLCAGWVHGAVHGGAGGPCWDRQATTWPWSWPTSRHSGLSAITLTELVTVVQLTVTSFSSSHVTYGTRLPDTPRYCLLLKSYTKYIQYTCILSSQYSCYLLLLARDSIYAIARYMPSPVRLSVRLSVCLSLCPSHGWISQRRLKLGSRNLHHRVAPWL